MKSILKFLGTTSGVALLGTSAVVASPVVASVVLASDEEKEDVVPKATSDTNDKEKKVEIDEITELEAKMTVEEFIKHNCEDIVGMEEVKKNLEQFAATAKLYKKWKDANKNVKSLEFHTIFKGNPGLYFDTFLSISHLVL